MVPSELRRSKRSEEENAKLKRLLGDLSLDKAMLQDAWEKGSKALSQAGTSRGSDQLLWRKPASDVRGAEAVAAVYITVPSRATLRSGEITATRVRYGYGTETGTGATSLTAKHTPVQKMEAVRPAPGNEEVVGRMR